MQRGALGLVLVIVLAGCTAPIAPPAGNGTSQTTGTPSATTQTSSQADIQVENGTLAVDEDRLFQTVVGMLDTDAAPPDTIVFESDRAMAIASDPMPPFARLMGIRRPPGASRTGTALGYVGDPSTVHVHEKLQDDDRQARLTLVHEYSHVVQRRNGVMQTVSSNITASQTTDGTVVTRSTIEGAATAVTTAYWERSIETGTSPAATMESAYEGTSGARQWLYAPYHFGYRYVDERTRTVADIDDVYRNPPRTSEELIHELPPGSEPVPSLAVAIDSKSWERNGTDRTGELFVRVALDTELSSATAERAAAGWGNDVRVAIDHDDGGRAYVWALRWDDARNATAFDGAMTDFLEDRGTRTDGGYWIDDGDAFSTTQVSTETIVVVAGNQSFVRSANVSGSNERVRVRA